MDKIAAYEQALSELETEKLAEEVYELYGVRGFLPAGYAEVFMAMHKEANVATGAVGALGKLRNWVVGAGAKMSRFGNEQTLKGLENLTGKAAPSMLGELRHTGGSLIHRAGNFVQQNPYLSATGAAGLAGYGGYKALT
jgi:hypothetical protein